MKIVMDFDSNLSLFWRKTHMFEFLIKKLKAHPRKIVFTEGTDPRILEASARLLSGTFLTPVLVGNVDEVQKAAEDIGFNIRGAEIIDPTTFADMDKMVDEMVALRKGKMSPEQCRAALLQGNYFGTMLVKMGYAVKLIRLLFGHHIEVRLLRLLLSRRIQQ